MNWNVQGHLKGWLWCLASLLWAEHNFYCSITGLRKAEKMPMTMLVLVVWARQHPMKTLKLWRKWVLDNRRITIREVVHDVSMSFGSCQPSAHTGSEDCSKMIKFWEKTTSHGHRSGDVDDVQRWSRFAKKKGHNWWRIMSVWLWRPNGSVQGRAETGKSTSSSIKCESFVYCFLRLQWRGASWIFATKSYGQ